MTARPIISVLTAALAFCALAGAAQAQQTPSSQNKAQMRLSAEVFTGFADIRTDAEDFNAFFVERAEAGFDLVWGQMGGELRVESIRSAGPQSVLGVDGDSLVLRLKRGWGFRRFEFDPVRAEVRLGLLPEPWIDTFQFGYDLRAIVPSVGERGLFFDTSDLGLETIVQGWEGLVTLRVAVTNGEGRNQTEQNTGKNTTALLQIRPLVFELRGSQAWLGAQVAYRDGSVGVSSAQNHRLAAALLFSTDWAGAGAEYVSATGYLGQPELNASGLGLWAHGLIARPWIGLIGRYDQLSIDADDADNTQTIITAGLYSELGPTGMGLADPRMRLYLIVQQERFGDTGGPVPGAPDVAEARHVRLVLEWRGSTQPY